MVEMGWAGTKNGRLLVLATAAFDAFITVDQNLPHQQNLDRLPIAVIRLVARANTIDVLAPLAPGILVALTRLAPPEARRELACPMPARARDNERRADPSEHDEEDHEGTRVMERGGEQARGSCLRFEESRGQPRLDESGGYANCLVWRRRAHAGAVPSRAEPAPRARTWRGPSLEAQRFELLEAEAELALAELDLVDGGALGAATCPIGKFRAAASATRAE